MVFELDYQKRYWDSLMEIIENEKGVAALMGNFQAESNCIPYRKQGDYSPPYLESQTYTNAIDDGTITENTFVNDSIGYGVAQWTYYNRKQNLYNLHKSNNLSIGSFELSILMIKYEFNNGYGDTLDVLRQAVDIPTASNYVLHNYESPADQSADVESLRAEYSIEIYEKFTGSLPDPGPGSKKKMPLWFYLIGGNKYGFV